MSDLRPALDAALARLVARGVLTDDQAAAVRQEVQGADEARGGPRVAEILGFAGGILILAAAVTLGAQLWDQLATWARLAVLALAAAVLWAAGRWTATSGTATRLTGVLWLASTAATAGAAWVAADRLFGAAEEVSAFVLALAATAQALALWRRRRRGLQHVGLFAGVVLTVVTGLALVPHTPGELAGLAVWAVGIGWGLLTWGGIAAPARSGYALGLLGALGGAEVLFFGYPTAGLLLGLAAAVAGFAAARALAEPVTAGLGAAGLAVLVPQALHHWFPGSVGAPAAVFLAGVLILAGAVVTVRTAQAGASAHPLVGADADPASEPGEVT